MGQYIYNDVGNAYKIRREHLTVVLTLHQNYYVARKLIIKHAIIVISVTDYFFYRIILKIVKLNLTVFVRGGRFRNPSQKVGSLQNNLRIKKIYLAPLHKSNWNRFPEVYRKRPPLVLEMMLKSQGKSISVPFKIYIILPH